MLGAAGSGNDVIHAVSARGKWKRNREPDAIHIGPSPAIAGGRCAPANGERLGSQVDLFSGIPRAPDSPYRVPNVLLETSGMPMHTKINP